MGNSQKSQQKPKVSTSPSKRNPFWSLVLGKSYTIQCPYRNTPWGALWKKNGVRPNNLSPQYNQPMKYLSKSKEHLTTPSESKCSGPLRNSADCDITPPPTVPSHPTVALPIDIANLLSQISRNIFSLQQFQVTGNIILNSFFSDPQRCNIVDSVPIHLGATTPRELIMNLSNYQEISTLLFGKGVVNPIDVPPPGQSLDVSITQQYLHKASNIIVDDLLNTATRDRVQGYVTNVVCYVYYMAFSSLIQQLVVNGYKYCQQQYLKFDQTDFLSALKNKLAVFYKFTQVFGFGLSQGIANSLNQSSVFGDNGILEQNQYFMMNKDVIMNIKFMSDTINNTTDYIMNALQEIKQPGDLELSWTVLQFFPFPSKQENIIATINPDPAKRTTTSPDSFINIVLYNIVCFFIYSTWKTETFVNQWGIMYAAMTANI